MHPLLRRLLVVLGVGGLLALLLQLRRRLQKPPPLLEQTPTQVLTAKMPALAARIPDDIRKDIEATVEAARASSAEAFPI